MAGRYASTWFHIRVLVGFVLLISLVFRVVFLCFDLPSSCALCANCCQCLWIVQGFFYFPFRFLLQKFENTKGVIRIRKLKDI